MHNIWGRIRRWAAGGERAPEPAAPELPAEQGPPENESTCSAGPGLYPRAEAEIVAERLAEDEALRGDLTDAAYGPLLQVVIDLVVARGAAYSSTDELHHAARQLLTALGEAAISGDAAPLALLPSSPLLTAEEVNALLSRMPAQSGAPEDRGGTPEERGLATARTLAGVTGLPGRPDF